MATRTVCIEVNDVCTKICEVEGERKYPVVLKSIIFDNPEFSVDDGIIADRRAFGKELKAQLRRAHIPARNLVFILTSNKIVSREIIIPDMKDDKICELIMNERANYFPMDTSDHLFTFTVLEKLKESKQLKVLVYAAPSILVQNYKALAIEQGLQIDRIDYSGNAIAQWLAKPFNESMNLYLQINEKNSVFTIMEKGMLALQRNINFGFNTCMAKGGTPETVRPLIANIASVLEYYTTKNHEAQLENICIGGVGAVIPGLAEMIEGEFSGISVEILERLPGVRAKKNDVFMNSRSTEFISVLGASQPTINFYQVNRRNELSQTVIRSALAFVVVAFACGIIIMNAKHEYDEAVAQNEAMKARKQILLDEKIDVLEAETVNNVNLISELKGVDATTHTNTDQWNDVIKALEESGVKNMVISSVSSGSGSISMNITVTTKLEAAKLIMQLKSIPYFNSVVTNSLSDSKSSEEKTGTVTFSVFCTYVEEPKLTKAEYADETIEELGLQELNGLDIKLKMGVK